MTAINMGIFSEIANNKADCDLRNIDTNKTDIIIEYQKPTAENNYTWYRLYATGWVEQGGICTTPNYQTIVLPIIMGNKNYSVQITSRRDSTTNTGDQNDQVLYANCTTSSIYVYINNNTNNGVYWQVSGRADMTGHEILPQASEGYVSPLELLKQVYPIGSVYMGTQSTCPLASLFGTWELVSNGKALWTGNGTNANTAIEAGLPNITGEISYDSTTSGVGLVARGQGSGSLYGKTKVAATINAGQTSSTSRATLGLDASRSSSIYGKSSTVQPPAYVVNVWRRTA